MDITSSLVRLRLFLNFLLKPFYPLNQNQNSTCRYQIREVCLVSIKQHFLPALTLALKALALKTRGLGFKSRLCASVLRDDLTCGANTSATPLHPRWCPGHIFWHLPSWPLLKSFSQFFSASFSHLNGSKDHHPSGKGSKMKDRGHSTQRAKRKRP